MRTLTRDGVRLAYLERGSGDPPILFIHGWCCDHTHLMPQIEHFQSSHHIVAVDLRGHGASDAPEDVRGLSAAQTYTVDTFAEDLAWLIEQLDLEQAVVVGHSMGGTIGMQLAARYPERVAAVVAIDSSALPTEGARKVVLNELVPGLRGSNYREVMRRFLERTMFLPTDDRELLERVAGQMASAPQYVMTSAAEDMFTRDAVAMASACRVPLLFITQSPPRSDLEQLRELCPQVVIGQTVGAGHFMQLLIPDQVNAMIDRFLTLMQPEPVSG
jgi:pimeloyl-ACP methyl ester carboxylesterase